MRRKEAWALQWHSHARLAEPCAAAARAVAPPLATAMAATAARSRLLAALPTSHRQAQRAAETRLPSATHSHGWSRGAQRHC